MDVIVAAGSFPPQLTPRAIQNSRLVNALGWTGHLIVPSFRAHSTKRTLPNTTPVGVQQHTLWRMRFSRLHSIMNRCGLHTNQYPDDHLLWSMLAGAKIATLPMPDLLLTISHPLSTHLAALVAKAVRRSFPVPWIAFFSDPWTDLESFGYLSYSRMSRRINRSLEATVAKSVDAAVFTNSAVERVFVERFPRLEGRTYVVSQAFDPQLYPQQPASIQTGRSVPILRYIGDFYGRRSPLNLLKVIDDYQSETGRQLALRIEFIGRMLSEDRAECYRIAERWSNISFCKEVGYPEALALMSTSDVLMVLDVASSNSLFLPSKLCEYLGAGKPLLGFVPPGPSADLIRRAGGIIADLADPSSVLAAIHTIVEAAEQDKLDLLCPPPDVREQFEISNVAREFTRISQEVVQRWRAASATGSK